MATIDQAVHHFPKGPGFKRGEPPFDFNQRDAFRLADVHREAHAAFLKATLMNSILQ
jgi:hypothetical protein